MAGGLTVDAVNDVVMAAKAVINATGLETYACVCL